MAARIEFTIRWTLPRPNGAGARFGRGYGPANSQIAGAADEGLRPEGSYQPRSPGRQARRGSFDGLFSDSQWKHGGELNW